MGTNLLITVNDSVKKILQDKQCLLRFCAGTAKFREISPRPKGDSENQTVITVEDETTDDESDDINNIANMSLDDKEIGHTDNLVTNGSSGVQDSVQEAKAIADIDLTEDTTVENEKTESETVGNDGSSS